jgi:hypothetical protein
MVFKFSYEFFLAVLDWHNRVLIQIREDIFGKYPFFVFPRQTIDGVLSFIKEKVIHESVQFYFCYGLAFEVEYLKLRFQYS